MKKDREQNTEEILDENGMPIREPRKKKEELKVNDYMSLTPKERKELSEKEQER